LAASHVQCDHCAQRQHSEKAGGFVKALANEFYGYNNALHQNLNI